MSSSPAPAAPDAPLPVGFRFRPTDEELVRHYLKPKIAGRAHPDLLLIPDVDLSACEPWELPAKALIKSADPEWFFFAPLDRKYPGGHRSNRSTAAGYWKATGKDRLIRSRETLIGVKKTLVFHRGRAPRGHRTAWIMHEYRTAEPQLQHGQNGSFVLYRLFNKHEEEASSTPGGIESNSPNSHSPSASSPANPQHVTPVLKPENLPPSHFTQQPASTEMAHLLATVTNNDPTDAQEDPLLDVLAQLPDLQPEQRFDGFPLITSPMRPYTDHPFVGNVGGPDLSAYITSFISHQDLEGFLLTPALAKTDEHPAGNAEPNPTALPMPSNSSNNKILPEISWAKSDSDNVLLTQGADGTGAACCSSPTKILQMDTSDVNHEAGTSLAYSASAQVSHLYNQYQLHSTFSPEMEPPNSGALCSADSWTPYPQQLFDNMVEPSRSDLTNSDAFNGLEGWAAEPTIQQLTVSNFMDPHQGTAARRIRLVHSVQRASVTDPVLTSHLGNEGEAGSYYSTGSSSTNHNNDYTNMTSQTMAGEAMHIQGGGLIPTQVVSSVEVTGKLRDFSFDEDISRHAKLPHEANLKQRLKKEYTKTSQNVREGLQHSNRVPEEPSLRRRRQPAPIGLVVQLLCLGLVMILVFVGLWKSSLCKSLH